MEDGSGDTLEDSTGDTLKDGSGNNTLEEDASTKLEDGSGIVDDANGMVDDIVGGTMGVCVSNDDIADAVVDVDKRGTVGKTIKVTSSVSHILNYITNVYLTPE